MLCKRCHEKNRLEAKYCKYCGYHFTENDHKINKYNGFIGFIKFIDDRYNKITFKFIFESNLFKIILLIIFVLISIYNFNYKGSNQIQINKSDNYKVEYNKVEKEYYVILKNSSEPRLDLYIPSKIKKLNIIKYTENNEEIENNLFNVSDEIIMEANLNNNNYYIISDNDNPKKNIKILVYGGE